jgi:hypothetical protein
MTVYTERQIERLFDSSYERAVRALTRLPVYCGTKPAFGQLTGWVYEQTIQHCIRRELKAHKIKAEFTEHVRLRGKAKADLKVNNVAIEIKHDGLFDSGDAARHRDYRKAARANRWEYLYITRCESYRPYRTGITNALGTENVFFLDTKGDWKRFMHRLEELLANSGQSTER